VIVGAHAKSADEPVLLAIYLAEEITKGKAISASFAAACTYDIDIVVGGQREQVTINARDSAVLPSVPTRTFN